MKSLSERLRKLFALSMDERAVLAEAWALFLMVEGGLRVLSFRRLLTLHRKLSSPRRRIATGAPSVARVAWLVAVAGRYAPVRATCLKTALVLSWLLNRRGVTTTFRIGVARRDGGLVAHAWLDADGSPISMGQEIEWYELLRHA